MKVLEGGMARCIWTLCKAMLHVTNATQMESHGVLHTTHAGQSELQHNYDASPLPVSHPYQGAQNMSAWRAQTCCTRT